MKELPLVEVKHFISEISKRVMSLSLVQLLYLDVDPTI